MRQLVWEKENSEFKPVKLHLKIDLVSYPARVEGLGKYDGELYNILLQTSPRDLGDVEYPFMVITALLRICITYEDTTFGSNRIVQWYTEDYD